MTDFVSLFTGMSERDIGYLLKNMVQRSINEELTNSEISSIDNKTPVLLTNSKDIELMNDISIQSVVNIEVPTQYLMPEEPDGQNLKVWLKFQNAGELRDWSYQKIKSYSVGSNTMPGLFYRTEPNSMLKTELYSYFNGHDHYAYSVDAAPIRILPNITANKITSFFIRLVPISLSRLLASENNSLFTKVDDDQLRYGYSVIIDINGSIHFYIKNNYRQYHLFVKDAYHTLITNPITPIGTSLTPYRFENFNQTNFATNYETLCSMVALQPPFDDLFFKYNPTTHNMSVLKTVENNPSAVIADTSLVTVAPYLSLPMQEGKYTHSGTVQTTVYDNSGHGNNGTIFDVAIGGQWNDDNTFTSIGSNANATGGGTYILFPTIATIDSATELTISFWYKPVTAINTKVYDALLLEKNFPTNCFSITRLAGTGHIKLQYTTSGGVTTQVTVNNATPTEGIWYSIVARMKANQPLELIVNNVSTTGGTPTTVTSGGTFQLFDDAIADAGIIALFQVYTTKISDTVKNDLYYEGYHNPLFPKSENIQPEASETPDPIFIPFNNVYTLDKMTTPVLGDYRKINSLSGDNPLIPKYTVADGTSTVDPELNPYSIADGITTGGGSIPFSIIQGPGTVNTTIESSDSSNGILGNVSGGNRKIALRIRTTGATIGANILGKTITKAEFDLKRIGTVIGTVYCKIWNASGVEVATIGSVGASTLTDGTYSLVTFTNTANTVAIPAGSTGLQWRIGVEYNTGASGDEVQLRRKSSDLDSSVNQDSVDWSNAETGWTSNGNDSFEVKCNLYSGGTGSATVDPNIIMKTGSYNRVTEAFGNSDPIMTKTIGKVTLRLKKVGSPTGTATIALMNNASPPVVLATFGTINVSTGLTTTTADYTFSNYTHGVVTAAGHRIGIIWTPSASGEVHVMSNKGNTTGNNWQLATSYVLRYISGWTADTTVDLAGKIYTGGNNFDAFVRLSATRTRVATKSVNSNSSLHNQKITQTKARIKKVGAPGGIINCFMRTPTDVVKVTFSSVDVSTITADGTYHDVIFENFTHNYLINSTTGSGDKIVYEFAGSDASNYIEFNANHDVFDTSTLSTITQTYDSGSYVDDAQRDLAGNMYSGGEPDLASRTRVAQSIEHQDSILKGKKITRVKAFLYRTTVGTSGTVYCNIRRGTDDSLVKTIGTVAASTLSTTVGTPTQPIFEDTTNNYPMTVGDKVTIEFSGGNSTDQVGVLVREVVPNYDLSNSYIRKYDEVDYDDEETTKDLCAVMDEGGFFFTPDPGSIPDPTPVNDKDLIICAGNNKLSGFFETFLMEFRIYSKDITTDNADNLYSNRYSISPIANNQILMPFSLKMNTTDAV